MNIEYVDIEEVLHGMARESMDDFHEFARGIATDVMAFAAGYSGEVTPDGRDRHNSYGGPPGWADKSHTMRRSYYTEVETFDNGDIQFAFGNSAPYSGFVESPKRGQPRWVTKNLNDYMVQVLTAKLRSG